MQREGVTQSQHAATHMNKNIPLCGIHSDGAEPFPIIVPFMYTYIGLIVSESQLTPDKLEEQQEKEIKTDVLKTLCTL